MNPKFITDDDDVVIGDDEKMNLFALRYFVEGLGPIVTIFCNELALIKNDALTKDKYNSIINPPRELNEETLSNLGSMLKVS